MFQGGLLFLGLLAVNELYWFEESERYMLSFWMCYAYLAVVLVVLVFIPTYYFIKRNNKDQIADGPFGEFWADIRIKKWHQGMFPVLLTLS